VRIRGRSGILVELVGEEQEKATDSVIISSQRTNFNSRSTFELQPAKPSLAGVCVSNS